MKLACFGVPGADADVAVFDSPGALRAWLREDPARDAADDAVAFWVPRRAAPSLDDARRRRAFLALHGGSPYAFTPRQSREQLLIEPAALHLEDVQLLIAQLNAELYQRYPEPGALIFSLHPADIVEGVGALLMAVHQGKPVGCGAFKVIDRAADTAEIKRMYVAPSARGHKIGAAILAELEARAEAIGVRRFVLELGPRQPEAIHLYERAGYAACEPWGEFVGKDFSICMAKG